MKDYSLIEKLGKLMDIIATSPLFLFCTMAGVAILIFYIISIKKHKKVNKWIFIGAWAVLLVLVLINYNSVVLNLMDNLFDTIFNALYFPNLSIYIVILSISNISFFYSLISTKLDRKNRIVNFIEALIIDVLLVLIIDIVQRNKINVYEELTIYSNSELLVLLELTSAVFTSWILVKLFLTARKKLKKYDKKEYPKMQEIVFDEIK